MKEAIEAGIGLIIAVVLYTIISKTSFFLLQTLNVFTLAVVYFAQKNGEVFGAVFGSISGLIFDSFSLGVFGIAGLAQTITGFVAGTVAKRVNVVSPSRSFVFILVLSALGLSVTLFFSALIFSQRINTEKGLVFFQPILTAGVGSLVFFMLRKVKGADGR